MQSYMSKIPISYVSTEQALADIVESIAMEDAALSNILNAEGEIIKKAINISKEIDEFISVNESVNGIIKNVARLQILVQYELENAELLFREIGDIDDLEE